MHRLTLLAAALALAVGLAGCDQPGPTTYQGYVEGDFVYVAGKLAGRLDALLVSRGERVAVGQPLYALEHAYEAQGLALAEADLRQAEATLDDKKKGLRPEEIDQILADLRRAEASHELSRLEYERRVKLYASATIAKEELDTVRTTNVRDKHQVKELEAKLATGRLPSRIDQITAAADAVDAARATVGQARWNLDQMRQSAGVAGVVFDTLHYQGEWVAAGSPVVVLLPDANIKARFFLPEAVAGRLAVGSPVRVAWDGGAEPVAATIRYIAPQVEYTPPVIYSQGFREKLVIMVEADFTPADAVRLHPGQPIDVSLDPAVGAGPQ
ncbi:HlyD family efflux transporter periplasmic adaptor subunit [Desulfovibrio aerotolerans]|uniref:HlyD family efflux transporter periplasmic adaptor subunit n=1 Tax=Solidesulfovibrio aerotolerans TaxID=295255 RepID=A0A7C9IV13_9BACT|nr:HlyD family efflux transporter periplasmic adaptor subunit [Solidesulfovibrio aerotolerans]MYL82182.1 HlyD family efflux transporter periplasmic adaptor subunit [Solidesulfovibrio aerotolerans]